MLFTKEESKRSSASLRYFSMAESKLQECESLRFLELTLSTDMK